VGLQRNRIDEHCALAADCRDILQQSPQGQRLLKHLKARFHFNSSTAAVDLFGQPRQLVDRDTQLYCEGQRSVICYLVGLLDTDIGALREAAEQYEKRSRQADEDIDELGV
jgi:hypothetical protein